MIGAITTFLSRIIGAWIAGLASWLMVRYGVEFDTTAQQDITENLVGVIIPTMLTIYSLAHRAFSKKINPGDAAGAHVAAAEKRQSVELKAIDGD